MSLFSRSLLVLCSLLLPLPALAVSATRGGEEKQNLVVLADGSLMLALAELGRVYSTSHGTPVAVIRNTSDDPATQIEQGFDAHILLSADPTLVERLAQRGLIDVFGTQNFANTQLALVAPVRMKNKLAIAQRISFAALLFSHRELPIYITRPDSESGVRAQALMEGREFSHELATRAVVKPGQDEIIQTLQTNDGFALMLASAAVTEPDVYIVSLLPESTSAAVRYDAAVLASGDMTEAREFSKFLRSKTGQSILKRYGFQPESDPND